MLYCNISMQLCNSCSYVTVTIFIVTTTLVVDQGHTVDGTHPASVANYYHQYCARFWDEKITHQLVQNFFHPRYTRQINNYSCGNCSSNDSYCSY